VESESVGETNGTNSGSRHATAQAWALGLAFVAIGMDGLAFAAGISDGGRGWAFAFPCLCLNVLASLACAIMAVCLAGGNLVSSRGRDGVAWLAFALAAAAACGAFLLVKWSGEAVAAV
jgi:hypothetical protein